MTLFEGARGPWIKSAIVAFILLLPAFIAYFAFPRATLVASTVASAGAASPSAPHVETDEGDGELPTPVSPFRQREPAEAPPEPGAPVSGVVVDGDGRGVDGAQIVCEDRPHLSTQSDAAGRFELPAEADGCKAVASNAEDAPLPAIVVRSGSKNRLEIGSPGSISGVVVDEIGRPLNDFTVSIESFATPDGERGRAARSRQSFKDPMGAFDLTGLSPGRYILVATAAGKPPTQSDGIDVAAGRKTSGVTLTVNAGGTVGGTVIDRESKKPIAGVRVALDGVSGAGAGQSTSTDAQGNFTLIGIPTGAFSLRFSHGQYRERIEPLDARGQKALRADVDLALRGDGPSSEWTGIGATLSAGGTYVSVVGVFEGGPADTAGVKSGDQIENVEGKDMKGATVADCVTMLRGPEGTRVRMTAKRGAQSISFNITRAKITQ